MAMAHSFQGNVAYVKQQFLALLGNTSSAVKFICIVTILGYLLSFSDSIVNAFSVTPGYLLPPHFWIWTAFTFCFMELYFWEVLVDLITVGLCGKLIEPLWGQMEMLRFFAITNLAVAVLTTMYYFIVFSITRDSSLLYGVHIHGLAGYVAAVSVAVRQILPDALIISNPYFRFTNRNIPLTVLIASIITWAIGWLDGTFSAMFASGLIVAWIYLRFYQLHNDGRRGDASESFSFASFFPIVMQPVISIFVNPIYVCCLKVGVIKKPSPSSGVTNAQLESVQIMYSSLDPQDVERRRKIALKALSERLAMTTDSNRQNTVPKSIPRTGMNSSHQHGHSHHHDHQHQHQHQHHHQHHEQGRQNPVFHQQFKIGDEFVIPAIPLPPPPSVPATSASNTETSSHSLIDIDGTGSTGKQ